MLFELLDGEEPAKNPTKTLPAGLKGKIKFKNVCFGYEKAAPLMENVSFTAEPGTTVAIIGPSGAGKTTLINLLMRFYDIWSGHICIDGVDAYALSKEELRGAFARRKAADHDHAHNKRVSQDSCETLLHSFSEPSERAVCLQYLLRHKVQMVGGEQTVLDAVVFALEGARPRAAVKVPVETALRAVLLDE